METIITKKHTERNPHILDPVMVTVHNDQEEEITHLHEVEHIRI